MPPLPTLPTVPFRGVVREKGTRTPIAGAQVFIVVPAKEGGEPTDLIATTDGEGAFAFAAVVPGKRKVAVRANGFVPADTEEEFKVGKRLEATYYIQPKQRYVTVVRGAKLVKQTLEQTLEIEEIRRIPGTGGDALKAVQTLPGVARAPFGLGQLIVWGSAPGDTRSYVNGVFIPQLYHFGGLRATVNSDLVRALDFTPGGYGVDYGRGLGGLVEVETRRPKPEGIHGALDLSLIDGSLMIEYAPTKNLSIAAAARRSWIDVFLPLLTTNDFQISPKYWDYQAALFWRATRRDELDVFLFGSDDATELLLKTADPTLSAQFSQHSYYHRLLARFTHRFLGGAVLSITPSLGLDAPLKASGSFAGLSISINTDVVQYNLRAVARVPLASFLRLDAGVDFEGRRTDIAISAPFASGPPAMNRMTGPTLGGYTFDGASIHVVNTAPYLAAIFTLLDKRLTITPGLRVEIFAFAGYGGTPDHFAHAYLTVEPRLSMRFQIEPHVAVKGAIGNYHQAPVPFQLLAKFGNPKLRPSSAWHYVLGVEGDPTSTLHAEVNGFYKDMRGLIVQARVPGEVLENGGQGRVYGMEMLIRQKLFHRFFGWISYTFSRAERREPFIGGDAARWRLFDFDQTHILSLVASYELPRGFQIGARFRYVTGNPTTPVASWYYDASNADVYQPVNGPRNSGRLDGFHQLDVRFDKVFTYRLWKFAIYLDIQNVYNHSNPETIQYAPRPVDCPNPDDCQTAISGLPFLPSLGLRGEY